MKYPYYTGLNLKLVPKNSEEPEIYLAKIVYLTSEHICIELPVRVDGGRYGFFPNGTELEASFVGIDNTLYRFPSTVLGRKKASKPLLLISHPEPDQIERKQRRNYFRVATECTVTFYPQQAPYNSFTGKTIDLSGGGMAVVFGDQPPLSQGDKMRFSLELPFSKDKQLTVGGIAELIRLTPLDHNDGERMKYSFQIIDIAEEDRQLIIQYCFNVQLKLRRKRLRIDNS